VLEKVITALKLSRRNKNRVVIFVDGKKRFELMKSIARELKVGQELSEDDIGLLRQRDTEEQLFQHALRLISRRQRSEREIRERFYKKRASKETQDTVVARLHEKGLLDDRAFAEAWIENRNTFRPRSSWALQYELRNKGIDNETIRAVLEGFDDEEAAYNAAKKAARRMKDLSWDLYRQRLSAYLGRRGFKYSTINPVIERIWDEVYGTGIESEA
jgi:regulatory protein